MAQDTFRFLIVMLIAVVSNITMASTMEETVVVADRVDTSADSLAVSVNALEDLSKKYKISRERVRQIENKAFEKLQKHMLISAKSKNLLPVN